MPARCCIKGRRCTLQQSAALGCSVDFAVKKKFAWFFLFGNLEESRDNIPVSFLCFEWACHAGVSQFLHPARSPQILISDNICWLRIPIPAILFGAVSAASVLFLFSSFCNSPAIYSPAFLFAPVRRHLRLSPHSRVNLRSGGESPGQDPPTNPPKLGNVKRRVR